MVASEIHVVFSMNLDTYVPFPWLSSWDSLDPLNETFPTDESIVEVMFLDKTPWNDLHHRSSFLPSLGEMPLCLEVFVSHFPTHPLQTLVLVHEFLLEGNMGNITATMPLDISIKPGIVENIHIWVSCSPNEIRVYTQLFEEFRDVFAWSYEEMPGIDPTIVVHERPTYPGENLVRQRLHPIHPRKVVGSKVEVEKLLKAGFIYPIPLTDWVFNIVLVAKKQGMICVCVYYRDINRACPKDSYTTPFINQITDECAGSEI